MSFQIDTTTYSKLKKPDGHGYERRITKKTKVLLHSTNGKPGSSFGGEARYLFNLPDGRLVGAHFLVGKTPQDGIVQFLPVEMVAWHAGACIDGWDNDSAIGIEIHWTPGESVTAWQLEAVAWLTRKLLLEQGIAESAVNIHRIVAVPGPSTTSNPKLWRKQDPNFWSDAQFFAWRDNLLTENVQLIGVLQSCDRAALLRSLERGKAPLSLAEQNRVLDLCEWLEIDAAFILALWADLGGLPYGDRQGVSCDALNTAPGTQFLSFQLGLLAGIVALKNGGKTHLYDLVAGEERQKRILQTMHYIRTH